MCAVEVCIRLLLTVMVSCLAGEGTSMDSWDMETGRAPWKSTLYPSENRERA